MKHFGQGIFFLSSFFEKQTTTYKQKSFGVRAMSLSCSDRVHNTKPKKHLKINDKSSKRHSAIPLEDHVIESKSCKAYSINKKSSIRFCAENGCNLVTRQLNFFCFDALLNKNCRSLATILYFRGENNSYHARTLQKFVKYNYVHRHEDNVVQL